MLLNTLISSVADAGRELLFHKHQKTSGKSLQEYCSELYSNKGKALGTALAREIAEAYNHLDSNKEKLDFFFTFLMTGLLTPMKLLKPPKPLKPITTTPP